MSAGLLVSVSTLLYHTSQRSHQLGAGSLTLTPTSYFEIISLENDSTLVSSAERDFESLSDTVSEIQQYVEEQGFVTTKPVNSVTDIKVICTSGNSHVDYNALTFNHCPHSNCVAKSLPSNMNLSKIHMNILIFHYGQFKELTAIPQLEWQTRQNQLWILAAWESWAWPKYQWSKRVDGIFNASMTYRRDSDLYWPYGKAVERPQSSDKSTHALKSYSAGKTKGAFAYVSHCESIGYKRLELMRKLKKYINVDVFGKCAGNTPCTRMNNDCERVKHKEYRFFLSFENSLRMDYITEKFWDRLQSDAFYLPVAVGGADISDYTRVAPPDSFIHINNFTSLDALGRHLRYLMHNDNAYDRYHTWRDKYEIVTALDDVMACPLCELANKKPWLPAKTNLSQWWITGPIGRVVPRI